jgi:hypothetical protein
LDARARERPAKIIFGAAVAAAIYLGLVLAPSYFYKSLEPSVAFEQTYSGPFPSLARDKELTSAVQALFIVSATLPAGSQSLQTKDFVDLYNDARQRVKTMHELLPV